MFLRTKTSFSPSPEREVKIAPSPQTLPEVNPILPAPIPEEWDVPAPLVNPTPKAWLSIK